MITYRKYDENERTGQTTDATMTAIFFFFFLKGENIANDVPRRAGCLFHRVEGTEKPRVAGNAHREAANTELPNGAVGGRRRTQRANKTRA
jgi:hypothetical protein